MATPSVSPLRAGALLGASWNLLRAHPILLAPLVIVGAVFSAGSDATPFGARNFEQEVQGLPPEEVVALVAGLLAGLAVLLLIFSILALLIQGTAWLVVVRATLTSLGGGAAPAFGPAFEAVKPRLLPGLLTILLWALTLVGGLILLVVPGIILLCGLFPIVAVVVAEGRFGRAALSRTWEITRGHKGTFFLVFLAGIAVTIVGDALVGWVPLIGAALSGAFGGAVATWWAGTVAVFYHRAVPSAPPP